jgi:hypothetical protein
MAIVITRDTLTPSLDRFNDDVQDAIRMVLEYWATRAVTQMRQNARWVDRTSNARNGLAARTFITENEGTLVLFHTMPYGIWLEVRFSGQYAIIGPTLNDIAPKILQMVGQAILQMTAR